MLDVLQMTFPLWNCCKVPCPVNWKSAPADKEVGLVSLDSTEGTQMKLFGILAARWRSACVCNRRRVNVAAMKLCCIKYRIFHHILSFYSKSPSCVLKSHPMKSSLLSFASCIACVLRLPRKQQRQQTSSAHGLGSNETLWPALKKFNPNGLTECKTMVWLEWTKSLGTKLFKM